MSKLSHSNPNLDDVLHEGNKHLALGTTPPPPEPLERVREALDRISTMKPLPSHPWEMVATMRAVASEAITILSAHRTPQWLPIESAYDDVKLAATVENLNRWTFYFGTEGRPYALLKLDPKGPITHWMDLGPIPTPPTGGRDE